MIIQSTYQPFLTLDYIVNESENKLFSYRMVNAYTFLTNEVVTDTGFFFEKNTFIYGQNIKTFNSVAFLAQITSGQTAIDVKGKLKAEIFSALKDCLKNSDAVRKSIRSTCNQSGISFAKKSSFTTNFAEYLEKRIEK